MKPGVTEPRPSTICLSLLSVLALLLAPACADPDAGAQAAKVEVPEIEGAVAAADFCDLYAQIQCAASSGCCADAPYASAEACLAAQPCAQVSALLGSPLVADGTVVYDAAAAGDFLRSMAGSAAACGDSSDLYAGLDFMVGTRDEGVTCDDAAGDLAAPLSCKPGLQCVAAADIAKGAVCGAALTSAYRPTGAACADDDECANGPCEAGKCTVDSEALLCGAPPAQTPPSNATIAKLKLEVHSRSNSGSSASPVRMYFYETIFATDIDESDKVQPYTCEITGGMSTGKSYTCNVTKGSLVDVDSVPLSGYSSFRISHSSGDGLRVGRVCTLDSNNNEIKCRTTFWDVFGQWCGNCSGGFCDWCMIDNDGNGNCDDIIIDPDDGSFFCQ